MRMNRLAAVAVALALAAAAAAVPRFGPEAATIATRVVVLAMLAMSASLLLRFAGLASFAQAAMFGTGGYAAALLLNTYQLGSSADALTAMLAGSAAATILAAVIGALTVRIGGARFMLATLALGQCVYGLAFGWTSFTGGPSGLAMPTHAAGAGGADPIAWFWLALGLYALILALASMLTRSAFGRALRGLRDNDTRMRLYGYNTALYRLAAFIIAGAIAGLAGVLWAFTIGKAAPEAMSLAMAGDALMMAAVGGGTLAGGLIGAALVTAIQQIDSAAMPAASYLLGGLYVLAALYLLGPLARRRT